MRFKHIFALALALILVVSAVFVFLFSDEIAVKKTKDEFVIWADSYPLYALAGRIVKDVPGMSIIYSLQPQDEGLEQYTLSDWDKAIISECDVIMLNGGGYESFESDVASGEKPVITAVSGLKYTVDDINVYGNGGGEPITDPDLYLGIDGARQMLEAITANMLALDEVYTARYYTNLSEAEAYLYTIEEQINACKIDTPVPAAAAHKALYYTAEECGLDCKYIIDREPASCPGDNELNEILADLTEAGISVLLTEKQAPYEFTAFFEQNGITVISVNLMTSLTAQDGIEAYGNTLVENAKTIYTRLTR